MQNHFLQMLEPYTVLYQYTIDISIALSEVGLGNEMLTFSFSTACLYWANSYDAHKSKTDSWVTAVKSVLLQNKCDQPSPKSYDNSNARFSFHEMCQLCYCVVR